MIKKWTAAEDKQALKLADSGKSLADIASALGRTENSIRNRLTNSEKAREALRAARSTLLLSLLPSSTANCSTAQKPQKRTSASQSVKD